MLSTTMIRVIALILLIGIPLTAEEKSDNCKILLEKLRHGESLITSDAGSYSLDFNTRHDLKVLNRVMPALDNTRTFFGRERMAWLLENPPFDIASVTRRQDAVKELMSDSEKRSKIADTLDKLKPIVNEWFWVNLRDNRHPIPGVQRFMSLLAPAFTAAMLIVEPRMAVVVPQLYAMLNGITVGNQRQARVIVDWYKSIFEAANTIEGILSGAQSASLQEIQNGLQIVTQKQHKYSLHDLYQKVSHLRRPGKPMSFLDLVYGHSFWTLDSPMKEIAQSRDKLAILLSSIAELDVYLSLAEYGIKHGSEITLPQFVDSATPHLEIDEGHHPYLFAKESRASVSNSLKMAVGSNGAKNAEFIVLTGPNAGGKSTFLQMVAMLSIQAQIGAPVPAKALILTPMEVMTNIDLSDSIEDGKSFFRMESKRLAQILDRLKQQPKLLVIMDEILLGTNPRDRYAMEQQVIRYITESRRLALLATHDIQITKLANELPAISNMHVEETRGSDGLFNFTFKMQPGVSNTTTAFEVLRAEGVPTDLIDKALEFRLKQGSHDNH